MNKYNKDNPFSRIDEPELGHFIVILMNDLGRLALATRSTFSTYENARAYADTTNKRYQPIVVKLEEASE